MRLFLTMILFFCVNSLFAQKPVMDSTAYKTWPSLGGPIISKNGQYVFYNINNIPVGSRTFVVQSTDGKWKKEFKGGLIENSGILSDKYFLFNTKKDSMGMLTLGTDQIQYIPNTLWYNLKESKGAEYLFYPSRLNSKDLVLKNLKTNKERIFANVDSWSFDKDVLVLFKSINGNDQKQSVNIADIANGKVCKIWEGNKPENLILDVKHQQLAFKTGDSVWYYKMGSSQAVCIIGKNPKNIEEGLDLGYLSSFSKDGERIFASLTKKGNSKPQSKKVVELWSYTDTVLQSEQKTEVGDQTYLAVINIADRNMIRLQHQTFAGLQFPTSEGVSDTIALIQNPIIGDRWSMTYKWTWDLVSVKNGNRKKLNFLDNLKPFLVQLSPCGKYIIFFDTTKQNYFSYEISTKTVRNLTKGLNVSWIGIDHNDRDDSKGARGITSLIWLENDESVFIYDRYDIWKIDPLDKQKAVNLTNGYGQKNNVIFNYAFDLFKGNILNKNEKLYLTAFNNENKSNGFFVKQLDKAGDPELLHMGAYLYQTNIVGYVPDDSDFSPIKAMKSNMYVVRRMSTTDAPNYFSTKDFKTFTRLSDLQPQRKYNWYTTELHTWKSLDGRTLKGILYKPENFDPNKKYPIIFHYYERKSDGLNAFITPTLLCNGCNIDIPTYVSNGYLVFTPDIYYKVGDAMQGTYDAVISAANYVSTLSFVNAKKMGIQGCSFGGLQTNYLVTHTNLFAAAESSSGLADLVSNYGSLGDRGIYNWQDFHENGQLRMGGSLWERPEVYIKNSPIFQADKVTTPFLIMHTKIDDGCPFINEIELFMGLRRLGKKTWMLVYPKGNHGLSDKDEVKDLSTRMMQFFDHYLKDKPAPFWMLDGIRPSKEGINDSFKLDDTGRTPGSGLLSPIEQKKVDSLMTRKPVTITLK
ncbi:alpha/beta hydrolase family protein [Pedobacter nutrimenti]|uniref:alpha/beta hydrolase family protein n=1 Tax=Pedobacter nutrimenti TaxID=1241337 RepID=UPI00292FEDB3|nr:prolyl oligopeptidase family serine peptidase [Pedobacter nutrimenti]